MNFVKSVVLGCLFVGVSLSGWTAEVVTPTFAATPVVKVASNGWHGGAWLGAGYWGGDVTYSIGGKMKEYVNGVKVVERTIWDPYRKLKWPINVAMASVGGNFSYSDCFDVDVSVAANVDDPSGKLEYSDWTDELHPSLKDTYLEGTAALKAYRGDADLKIWLFRIGSRRQAHFFIGPMGGFLFQHFDWTGKDADQWYPPHPEIPHELVAGDVLTYKLDAKAPYVGLASKLNFGRLVFDADVALAYYWVSDEDDHLLQYKMSNSDCSDWGWKADARVRFYFVKHFYIQALINALGYEVTGVQKQRFYAGDCRPLSFEVDNKIKTTQISGLLALGCEF